VIGKTISHYKIIEKLGEGGMGEVYLADDTDLHRNVAIKFLPEHLTRDKKNIERFRREAQAAASLNHPNIVTIHEIADVDNLTFIVMEYVDGKSLRDVINEYKLEHDKIIDIVSQIIEGLSKAHQAGIVHRDIKPENIIIDKDARVKILDFGLAKLKGVTKLTKDTSTLGTVHYMSPEQIQGQDVDHRSDIWSVGVLLYEMLTGDVPFRGEYESSVQYAILNEDPIPVESKRPDIPKRLIEIVDNCLKKESTERYQNTTRLINELNQLKTHDKSQMSSEKRINGKMFCKGGFVGKLRFPLIIVTGILVGFAIYSVFFKSGEKPASTEKKMLAVLPFTNLGLSEDAYFAAGMSDEIIARLAGVQNLGIIGSASMVKYKNTDKDIQEIGNELGVQYILTATVQWQKTSMNQQKVRVRPQLIRVSDQTTIWSHIYDKKFMEVFQVQTDIAEQVTQALNIVLIEPERQSMMTKPTENHDAYIYYLRGVDYQNRHGKKNAYTALEMYQKAVEMDPLFALAWARLSRTHLLIYWLHYDWTQDRLVKAKEAVDKAFQIDPNLPEAHIALGFYYAEGFLDWEKALLQFHLVLKSQTNNPEVLWGIGLCLRRQAKFKQALDYMKKGFQLNPLSSGQAEEIAWTFKIIRNYQEAQFYLNKAIQLEPDNESLYISKSNLYLSGYGNIKMARGVLDSAMKRISSVEIFQRILIDINIYERDFQAASDRLISYPEDIENLSFFIPFVLRQAMIYRLMGQNDKARIQFDSAREILESRIQEQQEDDRFHSSLGLVYAGLGLHEKAVREGKFALEMHYVQHDAIRILYREQDLASIYTIIGEYDAAVDLLEDLLNKYGFLTTFLLNLDPIWDPLRKNPRFQKIVEIHKKI